MKMENNVEYIDKVTLILDANMSEQFLKVIDVNGDCFAGKVTSVRIGPNK